MKYRVKGLVHGVRGLPSRQSGLLKSLNIMMKTQSYFILSIFEGRPRFFFLLIFIGV